MDRRSLTHDEASVNLPAYLLGVLEPAEVTVMSAHVDSCVPCQEERIRLEETVGRIGTTVAQVEPPPSLRDLILNQLDAPATPALEPPLQLDTTRPRRRFVQLGLIAASLLIVGLAIWGLVLRHDLGQSRTQLASANRAQAGSSELLADASRTIPMIADSATGGYGTLYIGDESDEALLVVEKLPPTPSGKLYQIWLANGTSRVSAGLFSVDQAGSAEVMLRTTAPISSYQTLGITSESAPSGSQTPTGPRIIGCSLH